MSYKKLEIWILARQVVNEIHKMSMSLQKFEMYEEGAQIRKSSKNVKATIVEGYGRRIYTAEYLKFLVYAQGSNDETRDHLENLHETGSLQDEQLFQHLHSKIDELGRKINNFYKSVERGHRPSF
jgi:four helix bundle protein